MQKCIHFLKIKGKNFVAFTENGTVTDKSEKFQVSGIKEAQAIAIKRNAIPYNFKLSVINTRKKAWTAKNYFDKK